MNNSTAENYAHTKEETAVLTPGTGGIAVIITLLPSCCSCCWQVFARSGSQGPAASILDSRATFTASQKKNGSSNFVLETTRAHAGGGIPCGREE